MRHLRSFIATIALACCAATGMANAKNLAPSGGQSTEDYNIETSVNFLESLFQQYAATIKAGWRIDRYYPPVMAKYHILMLTTAKSNLTVRGGVVIGNHGKKGFSIEMGEHVLTITQEEMARIAADASSLTSQCTTEDCDGASLATLLDSITQAQDKAQLAATADVVGKTAFIATSLSLLVAQLILGQHNPDAAQVLTAALTSVLAGGLAAGAAQALVLTRDKIAAVRGVIAGQVDKLKEKAGLSSQDELTP